MHIIEMITLNEHLQTNRKGTRKRNTYITKL